MHLVRRVSAALIVCLALPALAAPDKKPDPKKPAAGTAAGTTPPGTTPPGTTPPGTTAPPSDSKKAAAPPSDSKKAAQSLSAPVELALPPIDPNGPKRTSQLGIYKLVHPGQPDDASFEEIERVLRGIAEIAPSVRSSVFMQRPPKACDIEDDACFALLGAFQQLDWILVGSLSRAENGLAVRVRLIDVQSTKKIAQAQQIVASTDKTELKAWAESLACKLLIPTGCLGDALIDADLPEMQLIVDNSPLKRTGDGSKPEKLRLPVGVHKVRVTIGQHTSLERPMPVLREAPLGVSLYAREFDQGGLSLLTAADLPLDKDGRPSVRASVRPKVAEGKWTRPVGLVVAGLGVAAAGFGGYELQHSKSLVSDANASADKNGGFYKTADLSNISSAKSAKNTGNIAAVAGLVAIAVGLTLAFAF